MENIGLPKMSLVAQYDDLCRYTEVLTKSCEVEFKTFVESQLNFILKRNKVDEEVKNLNENIFQLQSDNQRLETTIKHLKSLLDEAVAARKKTELEKNTLAQQIAIIKDILLADGGLDNQTKEKLVFLGSSSKPEITSPRRLHTIEESAGSLFSLSDIDQTDDDIQNMQLSSSRRSRRLQEKRSSSENKVSLKKKRFDHTEAKVIDIDVASKITGANTGKLASNFEEIPIKCHQDIDKNHSLLSNFSDSDVRRLKSCSLSGSTPTSRRIIKNHSFVSKINVMNRVKCYPCGQNIGYLKYSLKCQNCRMTCHAECEEKCPKQCIPLVCTPVKGAATGKIADYTSSNSPMIPPLIVHCVNEIELRGLKEVGLYRISGSEREVRSLREKFLNGRTIPCLTDVDIHVVCGAVKEFLRALQEPLITYDAWQAFVDAANVKDKRKSLELLYGIICVLPMPNRDTLAFFLLHLQKVAESPHCKMNIENLAKVFGPTLIGYSEPNPTDKNLVKETSQQYQVMQRLLNMPSEKWQSLLNVELNVLQGSSKTPEALPPPRETRLGPIYARVQKSNTMTKSPLTPKNSEYGRHMKMQFSSPLLK